jgi:hypothetical protein
MDLSIFHNNDGDHLALMAENGGSSAQTWSNGLRRMIGHRHDYNDCRLP